MKRITELEVSMFLASKGVAIDNIYKIDETTIGLSCMDMHISLYDLIEGCETHQSHDACYTRGKRQHITSRFFYNRFKPILIEDDCSSATVCILEPDTDWPLTSKEYLINRTTLILFAKELFKIQSPSPNTVISLLKQHSLTFRRIYYCNNRNIPSRECFMFYAGTWTHNHDVQGDYNAIV